jgi:ribosomal protein L37AE/L43A
VATKKKEAKEMTFVVCPFCKCGRASQTKPNIVACPSCGLKFRLVKIKNKIGEVKKKHEVS